MIVLSNNDLEIGIYPGLCIETKDYKKRSQRLIKWSEIQKSAILRHPTENLVSRLAYELNRYSGMIFGYEQIEEERRTIRKIKQTETRPETHIEKFTPKLFLKSTKVEEL